MAYEGCSYLVNALLDNGADPTRPSGCISAPPLVSATKHLTIVNTLLVAGANVNAKGTLNITALMCASMEVHLDIVKLLINKDVNVHDVNIHGETALTIASSCGCQPSSLLRHKMERESIINNAVAIINILLDKGAEIDHTESGFDGSTALMRASWLGHVDVVSALLDRGAEIDKEDDSGSTALMKACCKPYPLVVKTLIQRGADAEHHNHTNETCFSVFQVNEKEYLKWYDWFHGNGEDYVRDPNGYPGAGIFSPSTDFLDTVALLFEAKQVRRDFLLSRFVYASLFIRWMLRTLRKLYAPTDPMIAGHRGGVLYRRALDKHQADQGLLPIGSAN